MNLLRVFFDVYPYKFICWIFLFTTVMWSSYYSLIGPIFLCPSCKRNVTRIYENTVSKNNINNITLERRLPDAIIIGEMKCGTTALMTFLNFHPDIIIPQVELNFFSYNYNAGFEWFRSQMPLARKDQLVMEKAVYFMGKSGSIQHVYAYNPSIKMLLILRDPTDRTISEYTMKKINKPEIYKNQTLQKLVTSKVTGTIKKYVELIKRSMYYASMTRWLKYFSLEQFHIIDGEEFQANPVKELVQIEDFLGIKNYFKDEMFIMNEEKGFYCYRHNEENVCLPPTKGRKKHEFVSDEFKEILIDYFRPLNKAFFELVGRRFNWK